MGHTEMDHQKQQRRGPSFARGIIEVCFVIFLFYANLLMGEFTKANGRGKTFIFAIRDIFTGTNFLIAVISGLVGYVVFEHLRKRL